MEVKTALLSDYIKKLHGLPDPVLNSGTSHPQPVLRSDRINDILIYPGCFNPPHLGHYELLRHGFLRSGADLNIVAAIIIPMSDRSARGKLWNEDEPVVFTMAERIRLWQGDSPDQWFWIYDQGGTMWENFRYALQGTISVDGFRINWILLQGPDHIQVGRGISMTGWACSGVIVSNCSRPADFISRKSKLKTLTNCEDWEGTAPDVPTLFQDARKAADAELTQLFKTCPKTAQRMVAEDPHYRERRTVLLYCEAFKEADGIRTCRYIYDSQYTIRFVPAQSKPTAMSSTMIRKAIKTHTDPEKLHQFLRKYVLYPDILLEIYLKKQPNSVVLLPDCHSKQENSAALVDVPAENVNSADITW
ncbi:MAG: hypothetical protein M1829_000215 [Trizodia sp. TS-e1964]|nr:MAG: hypothetical protein M1829_000215 [Trizodia sp. TS-e1964]